MAPGETKADEAAKESEPRYSREQLRTDSYNIAGHPWPVVAGALHDDSAKTFTAAQVKSRVKSYMGHEQVDEDAAEAEAS